VQVDASDNNVLEMQGGSSIHRRAVRELTGKMPVLTTAATG